MTHKAPSVAEQITTTVAPGQASRPGHTGSAASSFASADANSDTSTGTASRRTSSFRVPISVFLLRARVPQRRRGGRVDDKVSVGLDVQVRPASARGIRREQWLVSG